MSLFDRPFLDSLTPVDRESLLALGAPCSYQSGETVLHEGDRTTFVVAITYGWCIVSTATDRGFRLILALRGRGDIVGDLAAIDQGPRSATVTALGRLNAVMISGDRFRGFLASQPRATALVMRHLGGRLRGSDGERRALASSSVLRRLAARLVELAEHTGVAGPDGVAIALPLPQHDLAATIGSSREAVAKALKVLRDRNVVKTGPGQLVVVHPELLKLLSSGQMPELTDR